MCPWGKCPGGTCPGGFCPVTILLIEHEIPIPWSTLSSWLVTQSMLMNRVHVSSHRFIHGKWETQTHRHTHRHRHRHTHTHTHTHTQTERRLECFTVTPTPLPPPTSPSLPLPPSPTPSPTNFHPYATVGYTSWVYVMRGGLL